MWLYPGGASDEFDFWTGTFGLVVFALAESFIFAFVFGMDRGWTEITRAADIQVPRIFRFVIRYVTPTFILIIFVGSLIKPAGDWSAALASFSGGTGWPLAPDSVIGRVLHSGVVDYRWFSDEDFATPYLVQELTRVLLLLVFVGCGIMIYKAWEFKARRSS